MKYILKTEKPERTTFHCGDIVTCDTSGGDHLFIVSAIYASTMQVVSLVNGSINSAVSLSDIHLFHGTFTGSNIL